jgi:hypothetical protein
MLSLMYKTRERNRWEIRWYRRLKGSGPPALWLHQSHTITPYLRDFKRASRGKWTYAQDVEEWT